MNILLYQELGAQTAQRTTQMTGQITLLESRHYILLPFLYKTEETEKEENKRTLQEAAQPANKLKKAAEPQPPVP